MSNHSIIEHRANYFYFKLEEDYVLICQFGEQYPQCKAAILAVLEHWINDKRAKGQDERVYMTYPEWIDALYGLFRRSTIIACMNELVKECFITRYPIRRYGKDTFEYALNIQLVQARIRALPERTEKNTRPNLNPSKFRRVQKQTGTNLDGNTGTNLDGSEHENPSKNGRNIDSSSEIPSDIDSGDMGAFAPNPHAEISNIREQISDTAARLKAIGKGEPPRTSDDWQASPVSDEDEALCETVKMPAIVPSPQTVRGASDLPGSRTDGAASALLPLAGTSLGTETGRPRASGAKVPKRPKAAPAEPKGPPVMPPEDAEWCTRTCLQLFDYWRGAYLIGKFKLMQASTCAKGLVEQYSREQVEEARARMNKDRYYIERGGADVCDVANNIHKYRRKQKPVEELEPYSFAWLEAQSRA